MKSLDPDKNFILNFAPIFASLSRRERELIMQKSRVAEYKKGDIIYQQFAPADAFYCVITGRVRIFTVSAEKKETLEYLNCGKYFGMISLLTEEPHSVNAEAANDTKILKVAKEDFQAILEKVPKLALDLSKTLSRRLRTKDIEKKRIFESNIISIFGAVKGIGRTLYAVNLALSLKKETGKKIIFIEVSPNPDEINAAFGLGKSDKDKIITLDTPFLTDSVVLERIVKDNSSGISILNIRHGELNGANPNNLNALLTFLTGDYHYIIVDLPTLMDEVIFHALRQSDLIHILTDYDAKNLESTRSLIDELFTKVNYPQEKIKVIINATKESKCLPYPEIFKILSYKIYASLPVFWEQEEMKESIMRIALDNPQSAYAMVIRRIARELGDVRVGLALSGGAAFGLAHIGVIKVLEKEKVPIDMVVGSSMGALVASLWAAGLSGEDLRKVVSEYDNDKKKTFHLLVDPCFPHLSFAKGRRIRKFLERHLGNKTFQDIKFPLKIVACNLSKREEIIYESGSLVDAVMASIAIPGIFAPTKIGADLIVDGGIIEPVCISSLVKLGIKKIIAVNVLPSPEDMAKSYAFNLKIEAEARRQAQKKWVIARIIQRIARRIHNLFFPNILDVIVNSMQTMEYVIAEAEAQRADVVLRPIAVGAEWFEFYKASLLIEKGEEEAKKSLVAIKSLVAE
ncbi:MAG TPA: patatin-like phospholipase family protein [Candidatus Omnitrophota bacterium]|nr:patatin-like phospholipase family protein [Candidatus Omnitrophota bacterium]